RLDQHLVVALAHHADHRLGAGRPDDEAAAAAEFLFGVGDHGFHTRILERLSFLVAGVLWHLPPTLRTVGELPKLVCRGCAPRQAPVARQRSRRRWSDSRTG